jgi:tetratricopeptide (TPR) repeat protein
MAQTPAQSAPDPKTTDPDELVLQASSQRGLPAAELLYQAALAFRERGATVSAVHSLERGLQELAELIESPPAARLGAALEFELGRACEEELGRFEEALVHYQRAFKLRPDHLEPLRRGRIIYQSLGDMDMVARLSELHLANLVAGEAQTGVALALELGQLKLKLSDPAGAVEVLRTALRLHNDASDDTEVPEPLLATLAEAYVSPEYQPGVSEKEQARRNASDIYLGLAKRYLDAALVKVLDRAQHAEEEEGETGATPAIIEALAPEDREPRELTESDKKAVHYLKKALDADVRNVTAAGLLETMYLRVPEPLRSAELVKLYKSGARVTRRGPKLLKLYPPQGPIDYAAVIDACRAGLDAVSSVDEWRETRETLQDMLHKSGDLLGLAALKEEEAVEAALAEERAELIMQAAEFYQRGGDQERYIACLKQAFHELPLHTEAFRKLSDYYKSRRDFIGLAVIQENRMAAQFETARLDLSSYAKQLEELAELYEKKLQDVVSAAAIWRRIDELLQSVRSQSERKRLGQRLTRIDMQVSELQLELERTAMDDPGRIEQLRRLAQLYRELHEPKHAATVYEELLQLAPTDLPSLKILIELREQASDVPGQLELLRQQVSIATDRAERLALLRRMMALCDQLMLQRDDRWDAQAGIEMTIWVCKSLLAELPSDRDALRRLSDALQLLGNKTELLDVLESYLKVAPTPREKLALHRRIAKSAEDHDDLARAVSHLERAVRICPPGPESEEVLSELARTYGRQGRTELAVQTLELCLRQNPRASVELYRILGRLTVGAEEPVLLDKSVRAFREVLMRIPDDLEAMTALQKLHRTRQEWAELEIVLRRLLRAPEPPLPPRERLSIALELAEVLGQHLNEPRQAATLLEQVQAESPVVDLRVHRHLRGLYEEMGDYPRAARYAERELLLTEEPVARLERALEIAQMWRSRAKDPGRALLSYERVERIAPELPPGTPEGDAVRRLVVHALEAMSQMFAQNDDWQQVVMIGQRRLNVAVEQGEAMQAAAILVELAQVYEERLDQAPEGFTLRLQAFELAPHLVSIEQLSEVAERYSQWRPLCELHVARVREAQQQGAELPIDSVLAASAIYEQRLGDPEAAFKLLRRAMPLSVTGAIAATTPGQGAERILGEMNRLVRALGKSARRGEDSAERELDAVTVVRDLISVYRGLVDELCRQKDAGSEDTAVRLHRLLGESARLREDLLGDLTGALSERMHAFTVGGERDHSRDPQIDAVLRTTLNEIHRLAIAAGQIKEAATIDTRRLDRAEDELRRQQVACEGAAWLDDHGGDPQRALRACLKALPLCAEGSDAQAEMRGRLFRIGQRLGLLAWDEIARAERALCSGNPRGLRQRLLYLASLWQLGAGDYVRAIDAAGQAYRLTYFPGGLPSGKGGPPLSELVVHEVDDALADEQRTIRAALERLAQSAPTDGEGAAKLVALLDNLATQLNEAGAAPLAAQVTLDAGQLDERRGRLGQAERRYQDALKQPATTEKALQCLERVYRQQRRLSDLAALLEKRRPLVPESQQRQVLLDLAEVYREINKLGAALTALGQAVAIDDSDAAPYLLMARIYEAQRTHLRAVECYKQAAQRSQSPIEAAQALQQAAELLLHKLEEPGEALDCLVAATRRILAVQAAAVVAGESLDAQPELVAARDKAWAGVEQLLAQEHRPSELEPLLLERLTATPVDAVDERAQLLGRRLQMQQQRRRLRSDATPQPGVDPAQTSRELSAEVLETLNSLLSLRPKDDELQAQQEELLSELGEHQAARDVALQRAEAAAGSAEPAVQAQRWLALFRRELELHNLTGAEQALERALQLQPDSTATLHSLVELHQRTGNHAGQAAALARLASHEPELEEAVAALRQAAQLTQDALGDVEGARRLLLVALSRAETAAAAATDSPQHHAAAQQALCTVLLPLFDLAHKEGDNVGAMSYGRRAIETEAVPAGRAAELHNFLGQAALATGSTFDAIHHFESALRAEPGQLEPTRALVELLYPAGEFARIDTLVAQVLSAADGGEITLQDGERATLLRRQAEAREALGLMAEAYAALWAAEQLSPGDLAQQLWLGDSAFALGEHEVAARALGGLSVYAADPTALPAPLTTELLADALDRAAQSHLALQDAGQARQLWQIALGIAPEHAAAAAHYLDLLLASSDAEDAAVAMGLLSGRAERALQAGDLQTGLGEYQRAAELAGRLGDTAKAHELLVASLAHIPSPTPEELLTVRRSLESRLSDSAERLGDLPAAITYAQGLAATAATAEEQARWLHRAAGWALSAQRPEDGKALLRQALQATPAAVALIEELAVLLDGSEMAETLPAVLSAATPADAATARRLMALWQQAAQAQLGQGQGGAAAGSYDRAIALSLTAEPAAEPRLRRAALEVLPDTEAERARAHLLVLLRHDPFDKELLGRLRLLEERAEHRGAAARLQQLLALLEPTGVAPAALPLVPPGIRLDESDHARWADPPARVFAEVMTALWDGVYGLKAPTLDSFGVASTDRLQPSESSADELARTFAAACRVLGNQRAGLFRAAGQQHVLPKVFARMPTALVVSPALSKRPIGELQFILARGVEGLRPEYILATSMPPAELAKLLGLAVRAFHPRHAAKPADDVAAWKRDLAYRAVKRLTELLRDHPDVMFSTVAWRRSVRRTLQRAALLFSGDLISAVSVIRGVDLAASHEPRLDGYYLRLDHHGAEAAAEAEADVRDLCTFFIDPQNAALLDRLHPR